MEILAFFPALFLVPAVDAFLRAWTDWAPEFSLARLGAVLLLTMLLSLLAALSAGRSVRPARIDPGDLF